MRKERLKNKNKTEKLGIKSKQVIEKNKRKRRTLNSKRKNSENDELKTVGSAVTLDVEL